MKKLILLFSVFLFSTTLFGQVEGLEGPCITGPSTIPLNNTAVYTASSASAYYWTVTSGLQIQGSNTNSTVTVKCTGSGGTLSVVRFANGSCSTCNKAITCTNDCNDNPTAYFIPEHNIFWLWKSISTVIPGNYTTVEWSHNDNRVTFLTASGANPAISLVPNTTLPAVIEFEAKITYLNGCIYYDDFTASFTNPQPINQTQKYDMIVSPNPDTGNNLTVDFSETISGTLEVFNSISGVNMKTLEIRDQKSIELELDKLQKGLYLLRFTDDSGTTMVRKVIIE